MPDTSSVTSVSSLTPTAVFKYFEEICAIPHGSGNIGQISDYLCSFAKEHELKYVQDEAGNVVIYKPAQNTDSPVADTPVILQAHMDMVAVSVDGRDMTSCHIISKIDGDHICADGTSLGGDDGIGVAYILAILASDSLMHPAVEAVFTTDEETGMDGARALDPALLTGRRMINLDSEEEGHLLAGCAGGARVYLTLGLGKTEDIPAKTMQIRITGCAGGHSGNEIHKQSANANILAGRILYELSAHFDLNLISLSGGEVDNAIPKYSVITFGCDESRVSVSRLKEEFDRITGEIISEYHTTDPEMKITMTDVNTDAAGGADTAIGSSSASVDITKQVAGLLRSLPNGVISMSNDVAGLVETSLNLGVMSTESEAGSPSSSHCVRLQFAVRSSVESAKHALIDKLRAIADLSGAGIEINGVYPGWKFDPDSALRSCMEKVYTEMYGSSPVTEAIHAGLECGFFSQALPGLDCVSIGPDMCDIHTTSERLSIPSTARIWDYLCKVLAELC